MELRLERKWFTPCTTIGELRLDGVFECFTLEDVVREGDIFAGVVLLVIGAVVARAPTRAEAGQCFSLGWRPTQS